MHKLLLLPGLFCLFQITATAQWTSTQGPYGGSVYELKSNGTYVYASKLGGLYRSADVGLNWEICDSTNLFGRLAVDGKNLLASYSDLDQGHLRYSPDHGDHWVKVALPPGTPYLDNFAVKGNIILFTHLGKIWRSENLGQQWESFQIAGEPFQHPKLLGLFEGLFYLGNRARLLISSNGSDWTYLANVPGNSLNYIHRIYRHGDVVISLSGQTIGRSLDGGVQWQVGATEANENLGPNTCFSYENGVFYASTGDPMFKSTDNGLSWEYIDPNGPKLYYHTSQENVILGHLFGLGVFRSTDGGQTFSPSNHGLGGGDVLTIGLKNNDLWVWDEWGITRQNTDQLDWDATPTYPLPTYLGAFVTIFHYKNAVFVRKDHGDLLRSFDGGQTWDTVTPDASIVASDFVEFNQQNDSLFLSSEFYKTYLSTDLGEHWELINPHVDSQIGSSMKDMAVQGGKAYVTDNQYLYRSDDHLQTWQTVGTPQPFEPGAIKVRLFATPRLLFAFVNLEKVFRSNDQGETWTQIPFLFPPDFNVSSESEIVFAEVGETVVAFFERAGIFVSHDDGLTWDTRNEGIPFATSVTSFAYNENSMWVGTYFWGLYQRSTADLGPVSTTQPSVTNALHIFPNPTHGLLSCKLPNGVSGEAILSIYDIQGRQLLHRTTSAEQLPDLDLSRLAPGMYWVSIATQKGVFGGKVVLR